MGVTVVVFLGLFVVRVVWGVLGVILVCRVCVVCLSYMHPVAVLYATFCVV